MSRLAATASVPGLRVSRRMLGLLGNIEGPGRLISSSRVASIVVWIDEMLPNMLCPRTKCRACFPMLELDLS